ncbi:5-oxoprolinase subunit PxpB [Janibacter corallicola]|uniref:5-oxoprolinase subunit PxpB n=1 Tax=Janibacter corallicola TaxID=415212 RepID=UPI0008348C1D|nr:5-oxoprolinase subunit PxpB [Janibacter corallicola]
MRTLPCGDSGLLVELSDLDAVLALYAALVDDPPEGVLDMLPAARTLLLRIDPRVTDPSALTRAVQQTSHGRARRASGREVELPVIYDGEDLAEVGRITGLGERGVVEAHTAGEWTVAFCGFAPGFGYLVSEDECLHVPRRESPRTRVPAGSIGLAGEFTGVYPRESPGGWQLIGRTSARVWDLERDPPALLVPGTRVRFVEDS